MRGLLVIACLFASVLATSITVRRQHYDLHGEDHTIALRIPHDPRVPESLTGRVLMLNLEFGTTTATCGYANVTLNSQALPQHVEGDSSSGSGIITTEDNHTIEAVWTFKCWKIDGEEIGMLMKFMVQKIDGNFVGDAGFAAVIKKTGNTHLIDDNEQIIVSVPGAELVDMDLLNYVPVGSRSSLSFRIKTFEERVESLEDLYIQMQKLQSRIEATERQLARAHSDAFPHPSIRECRGLGCAALVLKKEGKACASKLYAYVRGHRSNAGRRRRIFDKQYSHCEKSWDSNSGLQEHSDGSSPSPAGFSEPSPTQMLLIGFLILAVLLAINRRERGSPAHLARVAAREQLLQRRAAQRAAFKRAIVQVYIKLFGSRRPVSLDDDDGTLPRDFDEKTVEQLVAMEEGTATESMVGDEFAGLRNAVDMVDEIIGAEAHQRVSYEHLPPYEATLSNSSSDGEGDVAEDQYTPTSSLFQTPSQSSH